MNRLIGVGGLVLCFSLAACGSYPYDTQYQESQDLQYEIQEGQTEAAQDDYDWRADAYDAEQERDPDYPEEYSPATPPCPRGCSTPKPDCQIKGNISLPVRIGPLEMVVLLVVCGVPLGILFAVLLIARKKKGE